MSNLKTAALSSLLVSKKSAILAPEHPGLEAAQTPQSQTPPPRATRSQAPLSSIQADDPDEPLHLEPGTPPYYKALTLKVDKDRFTKLKSLGVQRDLRSQALMTEALDLLFSRHGM